MKKHGILKSIIIALLICLILIPVKDQLSPLLMRNATYGMNALVKKGEVQYLFIGSSMFKQGLEARVLDENLGDDWYVLSYNGNQPAMEALELEYLLSHGVKIDHLYLDMYAYTAFDISKLSDEKILLDLPIKERIRLYDLLSENIKGFQTAWRMFVTANNDALITWPISAKAVNRQFYKGASMVMTEGSAPGSLEKLEAIRITQSMNDDQIEGLKKIIELSEQNGIDLTFMETPKYDTVQNDGSYMDAMDKYTEFLNGYNVRILKAGDSGLDIKDDSLFMDQFHLSSKGREQYTAFVTDSTLNRDEQSIE